MDLTTNQVQAYRWTTDMESFSIMKDNTGYGIYQKNCMKMFDPRTESESQTKFGAEDDIANFKVRDNEIYVVSQYLSEWDRRYLNGPVRRSRDKFLGVISFAVTSN